MSDRRLYRRFSALSAWEGELWILKDGEIEHYTDKEVYMLTTAQVSPNQLLALDLIGSGPPQRLKVRVLESRPVITDGAGRRRLRLAIVDQTQD